MPDLEKNKFSTKKKQWSSIKEYNNRSNRHIQKTDRENEKILGSQVISSQSQHQPTILLKNRETKVDLITKNDRSVSPKVKELVEKQNTQINVEAPKVKTFWDKSYKLIEYENFVSEPIQSLMDDTNEKFLVIGIMGKQGVGKSTFCNLMAQSVLSSDKIERIMKNFKLPHSKKDDDSKDLPQKNAGQEIIFEQENVDHIKSYNYCTKGIHIYVTENNLILLDCQPVLSIAYQEESYYHPLNQNYEVNNHEPYNIKPETRHEITDLQHLTFLLSVCNIVVFMQDWFCDNEVTRLILAASMLKQPLIIGPNDDELFDNVPKLMILHKSNKIEDYSYPSINLMNHYYNSVFNDSNIDCNTGLNLGQTRMTPSLQSDDGDFNLYLMPDYNHKGAHLSEFLNYETSIKELKNLFFRFGVNNEFDKVCNNQKQWLQYAYKVWESIQRNNAFSEFSEMLP